MTWMVKCFQSLTSFHIIFQFFGEYFITFTIVHFHPSSGTGALPSKPQLFNKVLRTHIPCKYPGLLKGAVGQELTTQGNLNGLDRAWRPRLASFSGWCTVDIQASVERRSSPQCKETNSILAPQQETQCYTHPHGEEWSLRGSSPSSGLQVLLEDAELQCRCWPWPYSHENA